VGYGGSCFPKDVRALAATSRAHGAAPAILDAVHEVNERQKGVLFEKIQSHFDGRLAGKTIAIWGLSFKPGTDDIREAPALALIGRLLVTGTAVRVYDPKAMNNVRRLYGDRLTYCPQRDEALRGADALAILTEWKEFIHPDFDRMRALLHTPLVFDGRNLYQPQRMKEAGFTYYSIGRAVVRPQ
jgi:UDPglucose 6-dehydrogenase